MRAILAFMLVLALANGAAAATPPGTTISNTAFAQFERLGIAASVSDTVEFVTVPVAPNDITLAGTVIPSGVAGAAIGAITVADVDVGDTHTIAVDDPRFEVVDGVLQLRPGVIILAANEPSVTLILTATDSFGLVYDEAFTFTVETQGIPSTPLACGAPDLRNPVAVAAAPFSICENSAGAPVLQLQALVAGTTATFDDPRFLLDAAGLVRLQPGVSLDFEAEPTLTLSFTVTQAGSVVDTRVLAITVGDRNEAPAIDAAASFLVGEGEAGVALGPITVSDPDADDVLQVSVDDARFEVVAGVLRLIDGVALTRAEGPSIPLLLTVTDAAGLTATRVVTVELVNANLPPVAEDVDTGIAVGTAVGTQIATVVASDPDAGDVLSYEIIAGNDAGAFSIGVNGEILVADTAAIGADGDLFELTVRVTDDNNGGDPAGVLATEALVRIRVTNANTPPFVVDQVFQSVPEVAAGGELVGVIGALDIHDPLIYRITGGDPQGIFAIDAATGEIRVARPELLDYETVQSYELQVSVTDSFVVPLTSVARITIPVLDVNEPPLLSAQDFSLPVNAPLGAFVGDVTFSDPDVLAMDTVRVTIVGGNEAGAFEIDPVTGTIKVTNLALLGDVREVQLQIRATDANAPNSPSGPLSTDAFITIVILDVNRAPTAIALDNTIVDAGVTGSVVGNLVTTDPDVGQSHTYSLSDPRFVVIDGVLRLVDGVALAPGERVALTVTAVDPFGLSVTRVFQIGTEAIARNPAIIDFLKSPLGTRRQDGIQLSAIQGLNLAQFDLQQPQCSTASSMTGPFVNTPTPRSLGNFALPVPGIVDLQAANLYKVGEPMFVRLRDLDPNKDPLVRDTVVITLTVDASRDTEILKLIETGPNTAEFIGYIQSTSRANDNYDCVLWVADRVTIIATYFDSEDGTDTAAAAALVDPFGIVFDSASGRRIDDALVRLVDVDTGLPAEVFGDEPFAIYPSEMQSGRSLRDAGGVLYDFEPGEYRFPLVNPGNYRLEVFPPNRFRFPSVASDADISALPDGPYVIDLGSRGEDFPVPIGPALRIDIPLDITLLAPTPATVELFRQGQGGDSTSIAIGTTQCTDGTPVPLPRDAQGNVIALPAVLDLVPTAVLSAGDSFYIRVTDRDEDRDPFAPDQIELDLAVNEGGDSERVRLTETGDSTGVFTGFFGTETGTPLAGDCSLGVASDDTVSARYVDADDADDVASDTLIVDPSSLVFDASSGEPIDGVSVTLIDVATGAPAIVFAADGVTPFPATVVTGRSAEDDAGNRFEFAPGSFLFPQIPPGEYRYELSVPDGFVFPSVATDEDLQALATAPFRLDAGSRGASFVVAAGEIQVRDLPLDPIVAEIFLSKTALDDIVAVGDFLQYQITVQNAGAAAAGGITLVDTQPHGFRYQSGSLRVNGESLDAARVDEDGRTLRVDLAGLTLGTRIEVRYVAEVTAGAEPGEAINRVTALGPRVASANTAEASVVVREDLLRSKAILIGRVFEGACDVPAEERTGLAGARIFLEDGTNVVTDAAGRWHIEGVEPGSHVVQLDLASLPESHRIMRCEDNTRFAGTPFSQFVDVQGGTLWRADFHVALKPPVEEEIRTRLKAQVNGERVLFSLEAQGREVPLTGLTLIAMLPQGLEFEAGSLRRNGSAEDDPTGAGGQALTFRLGDVSGQWQERLTFATRITDALPVGTSEIRTIAMFGTPTETRVRSAMATTMLDVAPAAAMPAGADVEIDVAAEGASGRLERMLVAAETGGVDFVVEVEGEPPSWLVALAATRNLELRTSGDDAASAATGGAAAIATGGADAIVPATSEGPEAGVRKLRLVRSEALLPARQVALSRSDSGVVRTRAVGAVPGLAEDRGPYRMRTLPDQLPPEWSAANVGSAADGPAILYPTADFLPRITSTWFVVRHGLDDKVELKLNDEPVSQFNFDSRTRYQSQGVALSTWRGVDIDEGRNIFAATITGADGSIRTLVREVYFSGAPVRGELVVEASSLAADGVTPPEVAIRFFDRTGSLVRPGMTGEYTVASPYAAFDPRREEVNISDNLERTRTTYVVHEDGIAYIPLEPTSRAGEVRLEVDFGPQLGVEEFVARLTPADRDWIVVGFGEGSVAYQTLSENMVSAGEAGHDDGTRMDGRVALFAKGMIQGKWLLTMAYDTDKRDVGRFGQQVDPNRFYTLYGDGSQQQFEAESREKLYLKIERDAFSALFGDFDTRLGDGELTRFSRRLTGVRTEYADQDWEVIVFGAETETAFVRDELRGNGTSGLYRVSGSNLLENSERITLETRDRFHDDQIIDSRALARFIDYNIDYDAGTLLFKEPVMSQDTDLNPIFIVVEYETEGDGDGRRDLIAGARVARRTDTAEVGVSFVHDGTRGAEADLGGIDAEWQIDGNTEVRAEAAWSRGKGGEGDAREGLAWLVEAERRGEVVNTRGYYREQEADFGVGQQSVSQGGTRRFGLEMETQIGNDLQVDSEAYQQRNLESDATRNVLEAEVRWRSESTQASVGGRMVTERSADGEDEQTNQVTARVQQALFGGRVRVNANGEKAIGGTTSRDFPTRVGVGAEFDLLQHFSVLATQEFTFADERDTQDTRIGLRGEPWNGAQITTDVTQQIGENAERTFATVGLTQAIQVTEKLKVDFGLDREQTLEGAVTASADQSTPSDRDSDGTDADLLTRDPLGILPATPPASGAAPNSDFTSGYLGAAWREETWEASGRLEYRHADTENQTNFRVGFARQLDEGRIYSVIMNVLTQDGRDRDSMSGDIRVALAWRPQSGAWTFLERLDLVATQNKGGGIDIAERKLVNNFAANFKPNARNQLALLFGAKYVLDEIDGESYSSVTTLFGGEYRYDMTRRWDLGLHGSVLSSWNSSIHDYSAGLSIGHTPFDNFWISLGYNFEGFTDDDFSAADFTAQGPFVKFRFKLDQESLREYLGEMPFTLD